MAKKVQLKERGTNVNIYPVTIKEAVGLGNVDNTSDANKPISTATQAALDELSKDIEIQNILSQLEPSADITKDLIIEMNDGTIYSVPNIDWTVKGEGNPKAASVNFSNSNFADLWVQGSEYLPKFKRVISYGDLSSVDGRINIYQIPGKIPHMWPNNAPDYELLLPLEQQEPPVIPEINVPREFGLSNLKLKPGYDLTFQCSGNIPFGIFYLTDFEGTKHDDSPRKYDHELTFTNVTTNSKLGEIFYGAKLDPRGIHITGLDGKVEKDGSLLLATRANWKWLPAKKDTKPAYWSFDLSKYTVSKKDFEFKGSYIGEDRFTKDNPMDMDWFGISQFSGHIFVGVENLKYIKASLPKATSVTYMSMSPFLEGLEITELGDANVANIVNACPNIRYIKINMSNVTNANNMFYAANGNSDYLYKNLTEVKLEGLKSSIDLSNIAALSLESVRYIFTNAVHILNKTITLYTDVYNKVPKAWLDEMAEKGWTVASSDGFSKFGKTANALKEDINYLDNKIVTKVDKVELDKALTAKQDKLVNSADITVGEDDKLSVTDAAVKKAFIKRWENLGSIYISTIYATYDEGTDLFTFVWHTEYPESRKYQPYFTYEQAMAALDAVTGPVLGYDSFAPRIPANLPPIGYNSGSGPNFTIVNPETVVHNYKIKTLILSASGPCTVSRTMKLISAKELQAIIGDVIIDTGINENPILFSPAGSGFPKLEYFHITIKKSFDVRTSPLLTFSTMQYLVTNAANTSSITVTVHPDVYAKLTGDTTNAAAAALTAEELAQWTALVTTANSKNISFATPE